MSETHDFRWIRVRLVILGVLVAGGAVAVGVQAFRLQILDAQRYQELARGQYLRHYEIPAPRGTILDRNRHELAISHDVDSVWADPRRITDPAAAARALAKALKLDRRKLEAKLKSRRAFVWIERRVEPGESAAVRKLGLKGVGLTPEPRRFYPNRELAAHVLGFAGWDSVGLEGVEKWFDDRLKGGAQVVSGLRDALGRGALLDAPRPIEELQGDSLVLTIDSTLQHLLQRELRAAVEKARAKAGSAILLDPRTGDILALANLPTYDPNRYGRFAPSHWRNRVVTDMYEPGSTFKIFTYAAALDSGLLRLDERIDCENSNYPIGKHVIHDAHPHGVLSAVEAFAYSSNIAAAKIGERLGPQRLRRYLVRFGFGRRTGLELFGETAGRLPGLDRWRRINTATIAFGQGVSASVLQIAAATGAIANRGVLMRPRLVSHILNPDGSVAETLPPVELAQVVNGRTARTLTKVMETVVEPGGTGSRAAIPGYRVAGKTGTSQKVDPVAGGYSPDKRIGSFVGFVPAEDPRLVMLVAIDEPQGVTYGGVVAAPVFAKVGAAALTRLGIRPSVATGPQAKMVAAAPSPAPAPTEALADGTIDEVAPASAEQGRFPNFRGLSMRQVLRLAQRRGVHLEVEGSGVAVSQHPRPGRPLGADPICRVRFRPET